MTGTTERVHIVLTGLMGAGKSAAGRLVANELGRPFVDSDSLVQLRSGASPYQLARAEGIASLHRLELAEANRLLARPDVVVFACAASVVDAIDELEFGRAWTCWLDASPSVLAVRTDSDDKPRPPLDQDADNILEQHHAERAERGRAHADAWVDTDDRSIADVATAVSDAWRSHVRDVAAASSAAELLPQGRAVGRRGARTTLDARHPELDDPSISWMSTATNRRLLRPRRGLR